jgi:hypothetical protein
MNKTCTGPCKISKPVGEFYKRAGTKDGLNGVCKVCRDEDKIRYQQRNPEKSKEYNKARYWANPEKEKSRNVIWCKNNPEKKRKIANKSYQNNIEERREDSRARYKANPKPNLERATAWNKANPERRRELVNASAKANKPTASANHAKRRAKKLNQSPAWRESDLIKLIFKKIKWLEKLTGLKYHADHIVPLVNDMVSGLDCWHNYQILAAELNQKKGNRWWPDMPDYSEVIYDPITNTLIDKV